MREVGILVMVWVRGSRAHSQAGLLIGVEGIQRLGAKMLCHDEAVEDAAVSLKVVGVRRRIK